MVDFRRSLDANVPELMTINQSTKDPGGREWVSIIVQDFDEKGVMNIRGKKREM